MGGTALAFPEFWQSPAFGGLTWAMPLWLLGVLWCVAAAGMLTPPRDARILSLAVMVTTGLTGATSVLIWTIEQNLVSAVGSAITWAYLAGSALGKLREQ